MNKNEANKNLNLLKKPWILAADNKSISLLFGFKDFKKAMEFVNKAADVAEKEGHHPDIKISYNKVSIMLTTHSMNGLSAKDFILASKIELL